MTTRPPVTTATTRPATTGTGTGGATTARPAASTATAGRSLALTGSNNGELAAAGVVALLAGALLVRSGRPQETAPAA
ncbi:MAG: LPXTG cell wall anchor domain-containing protein [Acidimicrobiales bacterium]